ncbi:hypothetical protein MKZ38_001008 [Zalerion maritima]|uniref:Beta-lactamase-related domain-containing protein n=1 Tax=Zalerion maritima TaxID=339359 RepID=A0AAD5WU38_9PEZI|nr:hypothetical protein MKZ38_001008 [Zalerion maritima]
MPQFRFRMQKQGLGGSNPHTTASMEGLLQGRISTMEKILAITHQPGMSIGVLHKGQDVLEHNFGVLDVKTCQKPDGDSLYCIASLSKAFMSASLDMLVQEGKISWDSTIHSILPDFHHAEKPHVFADMTVRDICTHRTGLLSLDEITQGLDGRILLPKKDVVKICNALPIKYGLRADFLYNNALYELAGCIVERVSGYSNWGDFQHDRIFQPLGMTRTTASRSVHETDNNIATPYVALTDGTPSRIAPTELSGDSMNGGSGGVRSSVNDLLKWCRCLLRSFQEEEEEEEEEDGKAGNLVRHGSPVLNRSTIANPRSAEDGDYCAGWCYHRTPARLGLISPNRTLESPMLGADSPSLLVYGHQGDVPGYTCNLYIVPESTSALVILSNGTGWSDATDWIAQDVIQTMHGLRPTVDFVEVASRAAPEYLSHYANDFKTPLEKDREEITDPPPLQDFLGSYVMENLDSVCLDVELDPEDPAKLWMMVNKQADQVWELSRHKPDVFSQLPDSHDKCLSRGLDRTQWSSFLIAFTRGAEGAVEGLRWKLDGVNVHFPRA